MTEDQCSIPAKHAHARTHSYHTHTLTLFCCYSQQNYLMPLNARSGLTAAAEASLEQVVGKAADQVETIKPPIHWACPRPSRQHLSLPGSQEAD